MTRRQWTTITMTKSFISFSTVLYETLGALSPQKIGLCVVCTLLDRDSFTS